MTQAVRRRAIDSAASPEEGRRFAQPDPQSQSFSRSYGPTLPTSLVHMIPSTRGVLPRRPDAVTSTARRSVAAEAFQGPSTTSETPREPVLLHAAGLLAHGIACKVARRVREKRKLFLGPSRASPRRSGVGSPRARERALRPHGGLLSPLLFRADGREIGRAHV